MSIDKHKRILRNSANPRPVTKKKGAKQAIWRQYKINETCGNRANYQNKVERK